MSLQNPSYKRRSLDVICKTAAAPRSPPKTGAAPATDAVAVVGDAAHPPLASMGKQGTFTKEKPTSAEATPAASTTATTGAAEDPRPATGGSNRVPPKVPPKPKQLAASAPFGRVRAIF